MNAAVLNTQPKRLRGLGCGCGCEQCKENKLSGTLDFLTDAGDIGKKAVVVIGLVAFGYFAYKVFTIDKYLKP